MILLSLYYSDIPTGIGFIIKLPIKVTAVAGRASKLYIP